MGKQTIMLVCNAGMSTNVLVTKMLKEATIKGLDINIFAVSKAEADSYLDSEKIDVLLLGPQVRFLKPDFEKKLQPKHVPVSIINMSDYGMMNGKNILNDALALIQDEA